MMFKQKAKGIPHVFVSAVVNPVFNKFLARALAGEAVV